MSEMSKWIATDADFKEQLRRWANTLRLEGNYVAAQTTERVLATQAPKTSAQLPSS